MNIEEEALNRPVFLDFDVHTVIGRAYAIYPTPEGEWMGREGQGINCINKNPNISVDYKEYVKKYAICFKKFDSNNTIVYTVMMNYKIKVPTWKIMDCPAYCARIRAHHSKYLEKRRERRIMICKMFLNKGFDMCFICVFIKNFWL